MMSLMPIDTGPILILDGATGTELERRGVSTAAPLWSARALLDAPEVLEHLHEDYLNAGADLITTCTFRTNERALAKAGLADRAPELTHRAVDIARAARDRVNSGAKVLGGVAPLEDCFEPKKAPDSAACRSEHGRMIAMLLEAGVDLILIETMNNLRESEAAATEAQRRAPGKWLISFCVRGDGPPGILISGEPLIDLRDALSGALAVGVNCLSPRAVEANVKLLRAMLPASVRVMTYPNVGFDPPWFNPPEGDPTEPEVFARCARRWRDAGASIIGGCCGTMPEHIRAAAGALR